MYQKVKATYNLERMEYTAREKQEQEKKSKPKSHIFDAYQLPHYRIQNM
jgi:hypothetical protein